MEKHDWTVTVSQQEQLYHAQCVSKQGETLTTELYETFEKALEAGHFIVERYCEQINGVKRRVQLDRDWLLNFYSTNDVSACYLDLRTGEMIDSYFVDEENEEIEYDDLEFSDFYLSIPSFSEGYQDMQAFFDSLENPILKTMAEETFYAKRKGGFKRIKNNPEIGFLWYGFEYEQQERRFYEWLDSENLELAEDEQKKSIREKVKEELISNIPELSEQLDQLGLEESNKQKLIQKLQESFNLDDSQTEDKEKCYYKCIAIAWKYIGEDEGKYTIQLFQAVKLDDYQSLYWWYEGSFNQSSKDFEDIKKKAIEIATDENLPILWNVGHLVKIDSSLTIPSNQFSFESMSPFNGVHFNYGLYPVNEQGSKLDFKSMSSLKTEFGLKDKQIRQLGEPDRLSKNPHYKNSSPMKLYLIDRVQQILSQ